MYCIFFFLSFLLTPMQQQHKHAEIYWQINKHTQVTFSSIKISRYLKRNQEASICIWEVFWIPSLYHTCRFSEPKCWNTAPLMFYKSTSQSKHRKEMLHNFLSSCLHVQSLTHPVQGHVFPRRRSQPLCTSSVMWGGEPPPPPSLPPVLQSDKYRNFVLFKT